MVGYVGTIEKQTLGNNYFGIVLFTAKLPTHRRIPNGTHSSERGLGAGCSRTPGPPFHALRGGLCNCILVKSDRSLCQSPAVHRRASLQRDRCLT